MDKFDSYMEEWAEPMGEAPKPPPEAVPMEKTVLIDIAGESENPKNYLNEGQEKAFEKRKKEGFEMNAPVDVYEPGFRSDLVSAIKNYWRFKRETRERHDAIRAKTGFGRSL
jgi:hypothetical protein